MLISSYVQCCTFYSLDVHVLYNERKHELFCVRKLFSGAYTGCTQVYCTVVVASIQFCEYGKQLYTRICMNPVY